MMLEANYSYEQAESFTDSHLPETAQVVMVNQPELEPVLSKLPGEWAFVDRAIAFFLPSFERLVSAYYKGDGPSLDMVMDRHQIKVMDRSLCRALERIVEAGTEIGSLEPGVRGRY